MAPLYGIGAIVHTYGGKGKPEGCLELVNSLKRKAMSLRAGRVLLLFLIRLEYAPTISVFTVNGCFNRCIYYTAKIFPIWYYISLPECVIIISFTLFIISSLSIGF